MLTSIGLNNKSCEVPRACVLPPSARTCEENLASLPGGGVTVYPVRKGGYTTGNECSVLFFRDHFLENQDQRFRLVQVFGCVSLVHSACIHIWPLLLDP